MRDGTFTYGGASWYPAPLVRSCGAAGFSPPTAPEGRRYTSMNARRHIHIRGRIVVPGPARSIVWSGGLQPADGGLKAAATLFTYGDSSPSPIALARRPRPNADGCRRSR